MSSEHLFITSGSKYYSFLAGKKVLMPVRKSENVRAEEITLKNVVPIGSLKIYSLSDIKTDTPGEWYSEVNGLYYSEIKGITQDIVKTVWQWGFSSIYLLNITDKQLEEMFKEPLVLGVYLKDSVRQKEEAKKLVEYCKKRNIRYYVAGVGYGKIDEHYRQKQNEFSGYNILKENGINNIPVIGVLIPTRGDRPEFLSRAKMMIKRQTLQPDMVEVVDDQPKSEKPDITWRYRIGCERLFAKGCDFVIFWEDDDWYSSQYIETMFSKWVENGRPKLFGIQDTSYYHIGTKKYLSINHPGRASMMATAVSREISGIHWGDDNNPYTDIYIWKQVQGVTFAPDKKICLGIKHGIGLCGGAGHNANWQRYDKDDKNGAFLKATVGEDYDYYTSISPKSNFRYELKQHSKRPFLSIITRRYKRPKGFAKHQEAINGLTSKDFEQIFIIDEVGRGLHEANRSFAYVSDMISGKWVYLLDDDDFFVRYNIIEELKEIDRQHSPDVILFRMIIKTGYKDNRYPTEEVWEKSPKIAHIGGSCFVVTKEIYQKYIHHFGQPRCGDFHFINEVWKANPKVYWHDVLVAETGKVSKGAPE